MLEIAFSSTIAEGIFGKLVNGAGLLARDAPTNTMEAPRDCAARMRVCTLQDVALVEGMKTAGLLPVIPPHCVLAITSV